MGKVFMSYYSDEGADAEDIARHLERVFSNEDLQVFMASRPESVRPGDVWQDKVIDALSDADVLLVLMTVNALSRPWINFEIGVAWARNARILMFCNRGMTPAALPTPYSTLQAVDINGMSHEEKLNRVAEDVAEALSIRQSEAPMPSVGLSIDMDSIDATIRSWNIRPTAHVDATVTGEFLVGTISTVRVDRARAAGFQPGEALFVRLFWEGTAEGRYINAMAGGDAASVLETPVHGTMFVNATIRLAAAFQEGDSIIPLFVVDTAEVIPR